MQNLKGQLTHFASQLDSLFLAMQVRVVLRVNPPLQECRGQPPVLRVDRSRKRVTVMEPVSRGQPRMSTMTLDRDGKNLFRTFNVDAAFPPESSQVRCAYYSLFAIRPHMRAACRGGGMSPKTLEHGWIVMESDDLKTDHGWAAATHTHFINSITSAKICLQYPRPREPVSVPPLLQLLSLPEPFNSLNPVPIFRMNHKPLSLSLSPLCRPKCVQESWLTSSVVY